VQTLLQVTPDKKRRQHFGSRLLWLPDKTLLMSIGDGGNPPLRVGNMLARETSAETCAAISVRFCASPTPADRRPIIRCWDAAAHVLRSGVMAIVTFKVWTRDPQTGRVWANEHGPRGGDELNLITRGGNFGWPLQTLGPRLSHLANRLADARSAARSGRKLPGLRRMRLRAWLSTPVVIFPIGAAACLAAA
jgi:glucose/arabinose dehydrogenase